MKRVLTALLMGLSALAFGDPSVPAIRSAFEAKAAKAGAATRKGKITLFGIDQCPTVISIYGDCLGNNPAAPYLIPLVPQLPGEYVDPYYNTSLFLPNEDPSLSATYRIQPNEAIVIMGDSPPKGAYFGLQSYLLSRQGTSKAPPLLELLSPESADLFYRQSPNPGRFLSFASLSEAINNVTISRQLGTSSGFGQRFYFVAAADRNTAASVKQWLVESGASASAVFTEALPSSLGLGLGASADDLIMLIRYALPENVEAGEAWRASSGMEVLRVSGPPSTLASVSRFGEQPTAVRTGNDESGLTLALNQLENEVKSRLRLEGVSAQSFLPVWLIGMTGKKCVENKMNCLGDTLDTDTYRVANGLLLDQNDVTVVMGVNHTQTQNATYVSLAIQKEEVLQGVASVSQTGPGAGFIQGELNGSVDKFLAAYPKDSLPLILSAAKGKLYVRLLSRNCSGLPVCTVVTEEQIAQSETITLVQRAYLKPGSTMGPEVSKLLSPRTFTWKR